jgi:hypothetical protein
MLQMLIQKRQAACNCDEQHLFPIKAVEAFHCFITAIFFAYRFALAGCKANFYLDMSYSFFNLKLIFMKTALIKNVSFCFGLLSYSLLHVKNKYSKTAETARRNFNSCHNYQNKHGHLKSKTNNIFI